MFRIGFKGDLLPMEDLAPFHKDRRLRVNLLSPLYLRGNTIKIDQYICFSKSGHLSFRQVRWQVTFEGVSYPIFVSFFR